MEKHFIAFAGNIGSGKTTAAKILSQNLGFELFDEPVIDNRFLAHYYADMTRWSFTLQMEFLIKRVRHHELIDKVQKSCVQDRTLYEDPEIFAKYLHGLGHMNDDELDLYFEYFNRLNKELVRPDLIVYLSVEDISILVARIKKRGRKEEQGIKEEFLKGLAAYYSVFPQVCNNKYGLKVVSFDVSRMDIRSEQGKKALLEAVEKGL
ncbi:MAG: deoxynucleoside kinase [Deltaproteobacteria bacterium]|nr:deoxynucleoside kinase [Deltaproteobacteria bacterium]